MITTESQLRDAIRKGGNIVITEDITLSERLIIDVPCVISCEDEGLLYYPHYHQDDNHAGIVVKSDDVIFSEFSLYGKSGVLFNPARSLGLQSGIKFDGVSRGYIINSTIIGFNWGGVHAFDVHDLWVTGNRIEGPRNEYYNYGVWQGGRGNASDQNLYFINNSVRGVKHAVGASGHPNNYYAINNQIYSTVKMAFDRHSGDTPKVGGKHTHIIGNTFHDPNRYAFSINEPVPGGSFVFRGNRLARTDTKPVGELAMPLKPDPENPSEKGQNIELFEGYNQGSVAIQDNWYNVEM